MHVRTGYNLYRAVASDAHDEIAQILAATPEAALYENDKGETCLFAACEYHVESHTRHAEAIRVLVAAGCDINKRSNEGTTALMAACYYGHVTAVEELLRLGADVNVEDVHGETALDRSILKMGGTVGHTRCRSLLTRARSRQTPRDVARSLTVICCSRYFSCDWLTVVGALWRVPRARARQRSSRCDEMQPRHN